MIVGQVVKPARNETIRIGILYGECCDDCDCCDGADGGDGYGGTDGGGQSCIYGCLYRFPMICVITVVHRGNRFCFSRSFLFSSFWFFFRVVAICSATQDKLKFDRNIYSLVCVVFFGLKITFAPAKAFALCFIYHLFLVCVFVCVPTQQTRRKEKR